MEIKSLKNTNFDTIFTAFSKAFADYELQLNKTQLQAMFKRRGFNPNLSFAAFEAGEIVAFTCNGIGNFKNISTAYDTGTGTLKDYRGQGLATQIFEHSLPYLKKQGIKQYLLEALQHNTKAISVYHNIDFKVSREFYYFIQDNQEIRNELKTPVLSYDIKPINLEQHNQISTFWDFCPSWQNSLDSIRRASKDFISFGIFTANKLIGYCAFEPISGDITQIAIDKNYRRKGLGSLLLQKMLELNKNDSIKAINADITCDSFKNFMEAKNIVIRGKQFEMIKSI